MVVMTPRETWTDGRLDDLNKKVDEGFARVDRDIRELRTEMNDHFNAVDARFVKFDERFDRLQQTLVAGFAVMVAAFIGSTATLAGIALF
jgi:hypothetical protein